MRTVQLVAVALFVTLASPALADIVVITGVNNTGTENVVFVEQGSGSVISGSAGGQTDNVRVTGTTVTPDNLLSAYTSGSTGVQGSGSDITSLTFSLTDGSDFERFVMNIDAAVDGSVFFSILEPNGDVFEDDFFVDGNGLNFFTFTAINGQSIESLTLTGLFGLSISSVTSVRIGPIEPTAVPEPASWAMMLLGFGAVGFAVRRRRQVELKLRRAF